MLRLMIVLVGLGALLPPPSQAQYARSYADRAWIQQAQQRHAAGKQGRPQQVDREDVDRRERLTPDERRELHRDLQRANREIYRKGKDGRYKQ